MSETVAQESVRRKSVPAPWHLWVIGVAVSLFHLGGVLDYIRLLGPDVAYVTSKGWGTAGVEYFTDYPAPLRLLWTVTLIAGIAAPVFLLLRSRRAASLALIAGLTQILLMGITLAFRDRWEALGAFTALWDAGVAVVSLALWWYCRRMTTRSVLR
jgi:hypothetical protein